MTDPSPRTELAAVIGRAAAMTKARLDAVADGPVRAMFASIAAQLAHMGSTIADGGTLHFHGEFGWLEETSGNAGLDLRIFDLSYERGGDRFQPVHWQVGRFLVRDMPEFGLLDGGAVDYRREGGDRKAAAPQHSMR